MEFKNNVNDASPTQRALIVATFLITAAIVITAYLALRTLSSIGDTHKQIESARIVQIELASLKSLMFETAAAERGYLITSQHSFLESYQIYRNDLWRHLPEVQEHIDRFPEMAPIYEEILQKVNDVLNQFEESVARTLVGDTGGAVSFVRSMEPSRGLREIRNGIDELDRQHNKRTISLVAHYEAQTRKAIATLLLSFGGNISLLCLLMAKIYRSSTRARKTREAIEDRNMSLSNLLEAARLRTEHVHNLSEVMRFLQSCRDYDEAVKILRNRLPTTMRVPYGALYLFDEARQLGLECSWGDRRFVTGFNTEACWALRRGQWFIQPSEGSVLACSHLCNEEHDLLNQGSRFQCLPMIAHGEIIGLLTIGYVDQFEDGSQQLDEDTLQSTIEHLSLLLGNLKLRDSLHQQSIRDSLTGLYNRRHLMEFLQREVLLSQRRHEDGQTSNLAVLMIDVDHFKKFNDNHGHDIGDLVLIEVSRVVKANIRSTDLAARYGGEEFVVVLPEMGPAQALERAEVLRKAVEATQIIKDGERFGPVTLSIGLATYGHDGGTAEALLATADSALYRAKDSGRNRVCTSIPIG